MKILHLVAMASLATILSLPGAANAAGDNVQYQPIRPVSDCLDASRSVELYAVDDRTLIAKQGRDKYYRIDLAHACPRVDIGFPQLKVADDKASMQRMCGEMGDKVITEDGMQCSVKGMAIIDEATYRKLQKKAFGD